MGGVFNARNTAFGDWASNLLVVQNDGLFEVIPADQPTCYRSPEGTFIDHFVVSADIGRNTSDKAMGLDWISDHLPIQIVVKLNTNINTNCIKNEPQLK